MIHKLTVKRVGPEYWSQTDEVLVDPHTSWLTAIELLNDGYLGDAKVYAGMAKTRRCQWDCTGSVSTGWPGCDFIGLKPRRPWHDFNKMPIGSVQVRYWIEIGN